MPLSGRGKEPHRHSTGQCTVATLEPQRQQGRKTAAQPVTGAETMCLLCQGNEQKTLPPPIPLCGLDAPPRPADGVIGSRAETDCPSKRAMRKTDRMT
eukprot:9487333-Pyramimonas_sp.AAC.1